jgi:hypothetical protein
VIWSYALDLFTDDKADLKPVACRRENGTVDLSPVSAFEPDRLSRREISFS